MAGIPGLSLILKTAIATRDRIQQGRIRQRLQELGLWPDEVAGQISIQDVERKLALSLFHDLSDWLTQNPERYLRLFIDGFERIQGNANLRDGQYHLQEFLGYLATSRQCACGRARVIIFGREKLHWDELYQDESWNQFWNQHLLGGLAQSDAEVFLMKCEEWHRQDGNERLATMIKSHRKQILDAADERVLGEKSYYPFYLNLAVDLIERACSAGQEPALGSAPVELQRRFLQHLDPTERRALQILAVAETFDEKLFDWLAGQRLIGYDRSTFHSQLRQERSYFQPVDGRPGEWRLHRKMEDALQATWHSSDSEQKEGRSLVLHLLRYYAEKRGSGPVDTWGESELEAWRRGMEIIISQGPEGNPGLLPWENWEELLPENGPWSTQLWSPKRLVAPRDTMMLSFCLRAFNARAKRLGWTDQAVYYEGSELAVHLRLVGALREAESIVRQMTLQSQAQPDLEEGEIFTNEGELAEILFLQGRVDEALKILFDARKAERKRTPEGHWSARAAVYSESIARNLNALGLFESALNCASQALDEAEGVWAQHDRERLVCLGTKGESLANVGGDDNNQKAIACLDEAYKGLKVLTSCEFDAAGVGLALARACRWSGDLDRSRSLCREVVDLIREDYGDQNTFAIEANCELGILLKIDDPEQACVLLRDGVKALAKALGESHLKTLDMKIELAEVLTRLNRLEEARMTLDWHLETLPKFIRDNRPLMLRALRQKGVIAERAGRAADAVSILSDALDGSEKVRGYGHQQTILTLVCLGIAKLKSDPLTCVEAISRRVEYFVGESKSVAHRIIFDDFKFNYLRSRRPASDFSESVLSPSDVKRLIKNLTDATPGAAYFMLCDSDFSEHNEFVRLRSKRAQ